MKLTTRHILSKITKHWVRTYHPQGRPGTSTPCNRSPLKLVSTPSSRKKSTTYLLVHLGAPPLEPLHPPWKYNAEKDNHHPKCKPRVQRRTQHHIVLAPPILPAVADLVVEDVAHDRPYGEIQTCGWRDPAQAAEHYREIDFAQDGLAVLAREVPQDDGRDGADEERPDERAVERAGPEEALGTYDAPQDTSVEVNACDGAVEAVDGFGGADAGDVVEHPVQDADLSQARYDGD